MKRCMRAYLHFAATWAITAALAACSVDAVTFTPGIGAAEDCAAAGDEDGNGTADCADPACAGEAACRIACGNGRVAAGELCADGNGTSGDGCDANCTPTGCGNGIQTDGELCDDGNMIDGDGCERTCNGAGSGRYEATADAMIRTRAASADASTSYGAASGLFTFGSSFGTVARSLLAFDLAAIPSGASIVSSHLHVRMVDQAGVAFSVQVREVLAPWDEATVTWNSQPALGSAVEASLGYQGYTWWRFDVTALVTRWVRAPAGNHGLGLVHDPELLPSGGQYARFESREDPNRPYLEIVAGI
jgi:cysteine-rich repeat protein